MKGFWDTRGRKRQKDGRYIIMKVFTVLIFTREYQHEINDGW
jgi:hypothetical protein